MSIVHTAAIDLGATSGRVIVGSYSKDGLELTEAHRFPNGFRQLGNNHYWDVGSLFAEICKGLQEAKKKFPDLRSCGVDTWGVDYVLTGKNGRIVFPVHAYWDQRTEPLLAQIKESGDDRKLFDCTGLPAINYNSGLQLCETIQSFPHITDVAERVLFLPEYFNFLLSGEMVNELSFASTTQLLDIHSESFSQEALDYFNVPAKWFGTPSRAGKPLGKVKGLDGLEDVELVLVPGHDTSDAYEAIPRTGKDIFVSTGTWMLVGSITDRPALGDEAFAFGVSNERCGDGRYRPNKILMGLSLLERIVPSFSERPQNDAEWDTLIGAAESTQPAPHLIDIKDRSLFNPEDMKAAIGAQFQKAGQQPPDDLPGYTRLICDSLGKGMADAVSTFESITGESYDNIIIVGGGSKNRLLCQRAADFTGLPVTSYSLEGTAVGNIGYQLLGLGAIDSLEEFHRTIEGGLSKKVYQPR